MSTRHIGTHHRRFISYPFSLRQSVYTLIIVPLFIVIVAIALMRAFAIAAPAGMPITLSYLLSAFGATFLRIAVAYALSLVVSIPLALLITLNTTAERALLPLFDIMQSVPVLAFFPVIIVLFVHYGFYNGAAICILFLTMLWSIVFSLVGGLRVIPQDIKAVGTIFGLRGLRYMRSILLPAIFPYMITGSLLAVAQGWNVIIVAEVLHTYLPQGSSSSDLFGIGSILVHASAQGAQTTFFAAIVVLVLAIALLNFFVWQELLKYAERFKFE